MTSSQRVPVARYHFVFRAIDSIDLPEYAGSLLRGQFGAALRRTACMTGQKECPPCPLYRTCPYPAIFETPPPPEHPLQRFSAVPNPYVIEPPRFGTRRIPTGEVLRFGLVLIGRALQQLPLIVFAFQRAFRRGIGRMRARAELEDLLWEDEHGNCVSVWSSDSRSVVPHTPGLPPPAIGQAGTATLHIDTPLRLQCQGHPLGPEEVRPRALLTTIMRRASLLFELHAGLPGFVEDPSGLARRAETLLDSRDLRWREWRRYSSRQKMEMNLGGVVGEWTLMGDIGPLTYWLWLGQWLHAGKGATMGMGKYTVAFGVETS